MFGSFASALVLCVLYRVAWGISKLSKQILSVLTSRNVEPGAAGGYRDVAALSCGGRGARPFASDLRGCASDLRRASDLRHLLEVDVDVGGHPLASSLLFLVAQPWFTTQWQTET